MDRDGHSLCSCASLFGARNAARLSVDRNGVGDLLVVIEVLSFGVLGLNAIIVIWFEGSEACRARGAKLCGSMRHSPSFWNEVASVLGRHSFTIGANRYQLDALHFWRSNRENGHLVRMSNHRHCELALRC